MYVCFLLLPPGKSDHRKKKIARSAISMRVWARDCRVGEEKAGHSTGRANIHRSKPLKRV